MEGAFNELRALFNTYSFPMHIIVKQGSKVKTLQDMKGLRIGIGSPGSVSMMISKIILNEGGVETMVKQKAIRATDFVGSLHIC